MSKITEYLKSGTAASMGRLIAYHCTWAAQITTGATIVSLFTGHFTLAFAGFALTLWSAAFGGKNWAKRIETKAKKDEEVPVH